MSDRVDISSFVFECTLIVLLCDCVYTYVYELVSSLVCFARVSYHVFSRFNDTGKHVISQKSVVSFVGFTFPHPYNKSLDTGVGTSDT